MPATSEPAPGSVTQYPCKYIVVKKIVRSNTKEYIHTSMVHQSFAQEIASFARHYRLQQPGPSKESN